MERALCVAVVDANGRFVFINSYLQKELKVGVIKVMHMTLFECVHPDDQEICGQAIACCALTGRQAATSFRLKGQTGKAFSWEISHMSGETPGSDWFSLVGGACAPREHQPEIGLVKGQQHERIPDRPEEVNEAILRAQEHERTIIGQELHDNVNQILFTCKLYLDLLQPTGRQQLSLKKKTQAFILMAIEEIRKLSKELVTPRLADLGLITCIKKLVDDLKLAALFRISLVTPNEEELDGVDYNVQVALFRIIQEQVKNISKYSKALQVSLHLWAAEEQVHLLIEDDGIGFDPERAVQGIGFSNIYDRSRLYNGKVDLNTAPGKGCSLKIILPFSGQPRN